MAVARRRRIVQWVLSPLVLIVIALGWKYPLLGFSVAGGKAVSYQTVSSIRAPQTASTTPPPLFLARVEGIV